MTNRRGFLGLLAHLPLVGMLFAPKPSIICVKVDDDCDGEIGFPKELHGNRIR